MSMLLLLMKDVRFRKAMVPCLSGKSTICWPPTVLSTAHTKPGIFWNSSYYGNILTGRFISFRNENFVFLTLDGLFQTMSMATVNHVAFVVDIDPLQAYEMRRIQFRFEYNIQKLKSISFRFLSIEKYYSYNKIWNKQTRYCLCCLLTRWIIIMVNIHRFVICSIHGFNRLWRLSNELQTDPEYFEDLKKNVYFRAKTIFGFKKSNRLYKNNSEIGLF